MVRDEKYSTHAVGVDEELATTLELELYSRLLECLA